MNGVNSVLGLADLKLVRDREQDFHDPTTFIPFTETVDAAASAGISVGNYIDARYNVPGSTEETIKQLQELGVLHAGLDRVCELGPGSGRYLERVRAIASPSHYEIYETAAPWARWLTENHDVVLRHTDGSSMAPTPSDSVDLAHGHKVMIVLPFLTICRYLQEMMRVTRPGGFVVFDVPTEPCLDVATLQKWIDSDVNSGPYPSSVARQVLLDLFAAHDFELLGTFFIPAAPGRTEYFAFRRNVHGRTDAGDGPIAQSSK